VNKRPGNVVVTTEVGFCSFCGRPRNLRHEQHQLGTLVRAIITCETCHRTLSSTIGVAAAEPAEAEAIAPEPVAPEREPMPAPIAKAPVRRKPAAAKKATATKKATAPKGRAPKKKT
jgi:hypothetical protein